MEIWTDGSITPQKALTESADILIEHLSLFQLEEDEEEKEEETATPVAASDTGGNTDFHMDNYEDDPQALSEHLLKSVEELELSVRSYNCLKNANIRTLAELVSKTEQEMLRTKNFGRKSLNEIKEIITGMGLHFNMRVDFEELEKLAKNKRSGHAS